MKNIKSYLDILEREEERSLSLLPLCAFENRPSPLVQRALHSPLSFRYKLGEAGNGNYYADQVNFSGLLLTGYPGIEQIEKAALAATQDMLGAGVTDMRPLSGVHGMICTILSCTNSGDVIYSLPPTAGGHFATAHIVEKSGRESRFLPTKGSRHAIDMDDFLRIAKSEKPALVFIDCGTPLFHIPIQPLRDAMGKKG